ncbi:peptidoglycan DD-metalloendopeptidase family protein [Burkholderia sp. TSV86]|uniref:peptidoglycan DD-metalloendopeptidase family protein n=1 Tax=Burkholderia sp. TSV86 TaxID=1385594 RepID=UPI000A506679
MRRTLFPDWLDTRHTIRVMLVAAGAALVGGCTVTPWTDMWQPEHTQQPAQPVARPPGVLAGYYRVNPGDTLASVAAAFAQSTQDVARWNHIAPTDMVTPGQVLRVAPPPGLTEPAPPPSAQTLEPPAASAQPDAATAPMLAWPARGTVTAPFGSGRNHGIEITATGDDHTVRAAAPGRVVYAGSGVAAYGPLVILKHDNDLITAYGHNDRLLVNEGDAVSAGQPVAEMATDAGGRATFEFEVRRNGKAVDPIGLLPRNGS